MSDHRSTSTTSTTAMTRLTTLKPTEGVRQRCRHCRLKTSVLEVYLCLYYRTSSLLTITLYTSNFMALLDP